jgi:hypothetical protein
MDTIGFIIDEIRERIRETSDDTNIEDLLIYSMMIDTRAMLIDQDMTKKKSIDMNFYQTVCINLCKDDYSKCCELPVLNDFKILRSKKALPEFLTHKSLNPFFITDITGLNEIPHQSRSLNVWDSYFHVPKFPTWELQNIKNERYVVISNNLNLKTVLLKGVFKDVVGVHGLSKCEDDVNDDADWKDLIFPISQLKGILVNMVVDNLLRHLMNIPEDNSNNAKSNISERD